MRILRENKSTLTTILKVLLYDPFYSWSMIYRKRHKTGQ